MVNSQAADREAEPFRSLVLRYRGRTGLTQRELAARMGASRRALQEWEAGVNYPTADRLKALIQVLLEEGGLSVGHAREEAEELWAAVLREALRMHATLDRAWLNALLAEHTPALLPAPDVIPSAQAIPGAKNDVVQEERRQDWGEAPDVFGFVDRAEELTTLRAWVLEERCRLVAVLGMGGIGKTSLAVRLAQDVAPRLQRMYWRSLRDALPITEWLAGAIGFLSDQQVVAPEGEATRLAVLLKVLQDRPGLLVLDNFDTLVEPGQREGRYRDGYAGYGRLLQAIGEGRHRSCLVVTSRESPPELATLGGGGIRTLQLGGLGVAEAPVLLADKRLSGTTDEWAELIARYGGNALALKVVGESIRQLFSGDVGVYLRVSGAGAVFGGIRRLVAEQVERSSALEQDVLRALAVEREPVKIGELIGHLGPRFGAGAIVEAVEALRRRSLVELAETAGPATFTLQSVVLEYVIDRLVEEVADEITHGQPALLMDQPLIKAQAKDYVRQTQERLIGLPILQRVQAERGSGGPEQRLLVLLQKWRHRPHTEQGYGPGNVVNLLRLQRGDLRGWDLTGLAIRQAYLAGIEAEDASLAGAHLSEAVLAEAFNFPISVALSGDGASLVAGTAAGEVWLWRVADRTPLLGIQAHIGPVYAVALSVDGRLVAGGSEDGMLRLWKSPSGQLLATLEGHSGPVHGVALSGDGQLLASGGLDGTVRLWDAPGGELLATLRGHTGAVWGVSLSADGQLLASGGQDGTVRLWDPRSASSAGHGAPGGRLLATLQGHTGAVWGVSLSADGRLVSSVGSDGTVRLWEAPIGKPLVTLQGHAGPAWGVALSANRQLLVSSGQDGIVRLWEVPDGRILATLQGHTGGVRGVALSADGQVLASAGFDGTVRMWEASSGRSLATLQGHTGGVWSTALSADGRLLGSGSMDGAVRLWEAPSGEVLATLRGHTGTVWGISLSADGRLIAGGGEDGTLRLWEAPSGQPLAMLEGHAGPIYGVALSADGRQLASAGLDGTVRLWESPNGLLLAILRGHAGAVWGVSLTAAGRLLASGGQDGTVRLWDASSGRLLATLQGHNGAVWGVSLSADGRMLASAGFDGTVRLWEVPDGQPLATLEGHAGPVWGVALSADGDLLASGGLDGTVRLWVAPGWRLLATLQGHTGGVRGVALSADGRLLASGSEDGTVRLWEAGSGVHMHTLRSDRRYERVDITGLTGVTAAQRASLLALGAVDRLDQVTPQ